LTRSNADRVWQEVRTDGSGRALLCTIPFSAWVLQRNTEARVPLVYRNDDGVDGNTLPPRPSPDQPKQGQVLCPSFFPYHSLGTRGNRPDPAPLLVQSAASLQCCALVVTRARRHGSTEAAFGAAGTRQTGAMPGSTQPLPRDRHLSAVCVTVPFSIGMDACHARSGRAMIERRLFSIAAGGTSCFGNSQPSEIGQ